MLERAVDIESTEVEARTAFGKAQIPVLAALCGLAIFCMIAAGVLLIPRTTTVTKLVEQTSVHTLANGTLADVPGRNALVSGGKSQYFRCRTAQLLDDVAATPQLPPTIQRHDAVSALVGSAAFDGVTCRPKSWLGPGSQLETLPAAVQRGVPVDNPLWASQLTKASVEELAAAELRLWHRLDAEWEALAVPPRPSVQKLTMTVPRPEVLREREIAPLAAVVVLVGFAAFLLFLVMTLAMLPDRVRVRFGLRGIELDGKTYRSEDVAGVWIRDGRLILALADGSEVRTAVLADASELDALIAQYQRLSTVKPAHMPADVRRLMGVARKQ